MYFTSEIAIIILAFSTGVLAAPMPQLHGEGAAADSILTDTDNGVGFGIENAEDKLAGNIATLKGSAPAKRQLHGEGAAADSILTDTDNGVGFGIENAEDNLAADIASARGTTPALTKRQLDKIVNGLGAVGNAAGASAVTNPVQSTGDSVDGQLTDGAANAGASVGQTEETTLENAGSSVPKMRRQLDKIVNGLGAVGNAAGVSAVTDPVQSTGDSVDGQLTDGAANAGASVGQTEETTLENAGSSVPKVRRQLDKIVNGLGAVGNAAGVSAVTNPVQSTGDSVDGELTDGAANAGASIGQTEETTLENAGSSVPKRF